MSRESEQKAAFYEQPMLVEVGSFAEVTKGLPYLDYEGAGWKADV